MTLCLETEIVATRFDPATRMSYYTIARNGNRWTVGIHDNDWARVAKSQARNYLAKALEDAMRGPADREKS